MNLESATSQKKITRDVLQSRRPKNNHTVKSALTVAMLNGRAPTAVKVTREPSSAASPPSELSRQASIDPRQRAWQRVASRA